MKFLAPSKDFTGAAAERARLGGGPFTAGEVPAFPASAFSSGEDVRGAPSSGGEDSFRAPLAAEVRRCLGMTSMTIPAGARQVRPQPQGGFDSPKNPWAWHTLHGYVPEFSGSFRQRPSVSSRCARADVEALTLDSTEVAQSRKIHRGCPRARRGCARVRVGNPCSGKAIIILGANEKLGTPLDHDGSDPDVNITKVKFTTPPRVRWGQVRPSSLITRHPLSP